MTWREKDHPRDPDGQFRDKAGGWVAAVVGAVGGRHEFTRGHDASDDLNWADVVKRNTGPGPYGPAINPRKVLSEIYTAQGYHQKPHVVDRAEMDRLVRDEGYLEIWRGFGGSTAPHPDPEQAARGKLISLSPHQTAQRFIDDDTHYIGEGFFGNGTYTTRDAADAGNYGEAILRMGLHPDARVYDYKFNRTGMGTDEDLFPFDFENKPDQASALIDLANRAAVLGYDAIRIPAKGRKRGDSQHDYYILLNRGAVAVQRR